MPEATPTTHFRTDSDCTTSLAAGSRILTVTEVARELRCFEVHATSCAPVTGTATPSMPTPDNTLDILVKTIADLIQGKV
jgi:hypothetical protein